MPNIVVYAKPPWHVTDVDTDALSNEQMTVFNLGRRLITIVARAMTDLNFDTNLTEVDVDHRPMSLHGSNLKSVKIDITQLWSPERQEVKEDMWTLITDRTTAYLLREHGQMPFSYECNINLVIGCGGSIALTGNHEARW